jgi:hypothetical protein
LRKNPICCFILSFDFLKRRLSTQPNIQQKHCPFVLPHQDIQTSIRKSVWLAIFLFTEHLPDLLLW